MQDPTTFQVQAMMKPHFPEQEQLKCPRCDSTNTKFCYYNNYNLSQPRHFCKNCRRYWTKGGALRNIPVGGGTRKSNKRSSSAKRAASSPLPSISHDAPITTNVLGSDQFRVGNNPDGQDPRAKSIGGSFTSFLASSGHFGTLLEGLNSNGPGLKVLQMGEFGGNLGSGPVENSGSGRTLGLEVQGNGGSEGFLALQNGDSSCWNGGHGWSDLAIYTPGSSFQ